MLAGLGLQSIVTKRCRLHARVTSTIHETPAKIRNSSPLSARITAAGCVYKSHVIAIQAVPKTSHWSNTACSVCVHIHWAMESEIMIFIFAYLPVCVASVVLTSAVPGITYEWTLQTVHRFHRRTAFKDRFIPSGDCGVFSRSPTANQSYGRSNVQTPPLFLLSLSLSVFLVRLRNAALSDSTEPDTRGLLRMVRSSTAMGLTYLQRDPDNSLIKTRTMPVFSHDPFGLAARHGIAVWINKEVPITARKSLDR